MHLQVAVLQQKQLKQYYKTNNLSFEYLVDTYKSNISSEKEYMERQWAILASMSFKFSYMKKNSKNVVL